jgi:hypothetical protein
MLESSVGRGAGEGGRDGKGQDKAEEEDNAGGDATKAVADIKTGDTDGNREAKEGAK